MPGQGAGAGRRAIEASGPQRGRAIVRPLLWRFNSNIIEFMDQASVVQALAALAHPVRLEAFRALVVAGHEGLAQKTLAQAVGVGPTNLAFHLKELGAAGLVSQAQNGRFVVYRASFEQMGALLAYLTENCCAGPARAAAVTPSGTCGC